MTKTRLKHHTPVYQDSIGNFGLAYHLEMIKDVERVGQIKRALDQVLQADTLHCELGVGTGIFAIYAAQRCRKVVAVERDPALAAIARKNIEAAQLSHKIEILEMDALDFFPEEKFDTLLVEMMSIWCINEPQVQVMDHARQHLLKPKAKVIPQRIINLVELGQYDFEVDGITCKASLPQFSGVRAPRIFSTSQVFLTLDFTEQVIWEGEKEMTIKPLLSGLVNCVRLSSLVELTDGINFYGTDSLMPPTIVPLTEAFWVNAGESLSFGAAFQWRTNLDDSRFWLSS